jgi:hypothetical protein
MFSLTRASAARGRTNESSANTNYQRTFNRTADFRIVVGSLPRSGSGSEAEGSASGAETGTDLPKGWMELVPGSLDEDIQFVRMTIGMDLVNNIIPSEATMIEGDK